MKVTKKIILADTDKVDSSELRPYVDQLLEAIGHPEALVTDESSLYDFGCFSDLMERQLVDTVRRQIGIQVEITEPLYCIAERLRERAMR